jgi:hypothetical protein
MKKFVAVLIVSTFAVGAFAQSSPAAAASSPMVSSSSPAKATTKHTSKHKAGKHSKAAASKAM